MIMIIILDKIINFLIFNFISIFSVNYNSPLLRLPRKVTHLLSGKVKIVKEI